MGVLPGVLLDVLFGGIFINVEFTRPPPLSRYKASRNPTYPGRKLRNTNISHMKDVTET